MALKITPLADRVIVEPLSREEVTKGGLVLPDTVKEKPQEGNVVAIGSGRVGDDGNRIPMEVAVGDTVIYAKYAGTEWKYEEKEYLILRESDIQAKRKK